MKINIKGLTPSVISLNNIGIIIRGNSDVESCQAYNIAIENQAQVDELKELRNANLISMKLVDRTGTLDPVVLFPEEAGKCIAAVRNSDPEIIEESAKSVSSDSEEPKKRGRGRPKGAKNKTTEAKAAEANVEKSEELNAKATKAITRSADISKPLSDTDTKVVVVDPNGPVVTKTITENDKQIVYDETQVQASLDAMKDLEAEEQRELDKQVSEEELDASEQMGREAIIGTGRNKQSKVKMTSSLVELDESDPFVDKEDKEEIAKLDADKNVFVEDEASEDEDSEFVEY